MKWLISLDQYLHKPNNHHNKNIVFTSDIQTSQKCCRILVRSSKYTLLLEDRTPTHHIIDESEQHRSFDYKESLGKHAKFYFAYFHLICHVHSNALQT